jgi:hypothetical protein
MRSSAARGIACTVGFCIKNVLQSALLSKASSRIFPQEMGCKGGQFLAWIVVILIMPQRRYCFVFLD